METGLKRESDVTKSRIRVSFDARQTRLRNPKQRFGRTAAIFCCAACGFTLMASGRKHGSWKILPAVAKADAEMLH
jgi:hypothetical protein